MRIEIVTMTNYFHITTLISFSKLCVVDVVLNTNEVRVEIQEGHYDDHIKPNVHAL